MVSGMYHLKASNDCPNPAACPDPRACPPTLPDGWTLQWTSYCEAAFTVWDPDAQRGFGAAVSFDSDGHVTATLPGQLDRPHLTGVATGVMAWVVAQLGPELVREYVLFSRDTEAALAADALAQLDQRPEPDPADPFAGQMIRNRQARAVTLRTVHATLLLKEAAELLPTFEQRQTGRALVAGGFTGTVDELRAVSEAILA